MPVIICQWAWQWDAFALEQGLPQGSPRPNCVRLYFRRWLRRAGPSSSLQTTREVPCNVNSESHERATRS